MGAVGFYAEEQPVREVEIEPFAIDAHPVTVREFEDFVAETGFVTIAERQLDPGRFPDADPQLLVPGSAVFRPTPRRPAGRPADLVGICPRSIVATSVGPG